MTFPPEKERNGGSENGNFRRLYCSDELLRTIETYNICVCEFSYTFFSLYFLIDYFSTSGEWKLYTSTGYFNFFNGDNVQKFYALR